MKAVVFTQYGPPDGLKLKDFTKTGESYDLIIDCQGFRSMFDYKRALRPEGTYAMVGGPMPRILQLLFLSFCSSLTREGRKFSPL